MLPFDINLRPGASVHEQVVYAAERALVDGRLRPGERFPSVRMLSKELRINPNTAHKIVSTLVDQGILEVRPGIGTLVAENPTSYDPGQAERLLGPSAEKLVVEARRLDLDLDEVLDAVRGHWQRLGGADEPRSES